MSTQPTGGQKGKRGRKRMNGEDELPPEEQAKKQKNREAAKKCREKKLKEAQELKSKNDELEKANEDLKRRKEELESQVSQYENIIRTHMSKGCKLPQAIDSILSSSSAYFQDNDTEMFRPVGTRVVQEERCPSAHELNSQESSTPPPLAMGEKAPTALFSGTPLPSQFKRQISNNCHSPTSTQSQYPTTMLAQLVGSNIHLTGPLAPITTSTRSSTLSVSVTSPFTTTSSSDLYHQASPSPVQQVPNIDKSFDTVDSDDSDSSSVKGNGYDLSPLSIDDPVTNVMYRARDHQTHHNGSLQSMGFNVCQEESMQTGEDTPSSSQLNVSTSELLTHALLALPTTEMTEELQQKVASITSSERSLSSSSSPSVHEEPMGEQASPATVNSSKPPHQQKIIQKNSRNQLQKKYQQLGQQQQQQQLKGQQLQYQTQPPSYFTSMSDSGVVDNRSASLTEITPTEDLRKEQDKSTELKDIRLRLRSILGEMPLIQEQTSTAASDYVLMHQNSETSSSPLLDQLNANILTPSVLELDNNQTLLSIHPSLQQNGQFVVQNQSYVVSQDYLVPGVLAETQGHTLPTVVTLDEDSTQVDVVPASPNHQQSGDQGHSGHMNLPQELQHFTTFSTEDGKQITLPFFPLNSELLNQDSQAPAFIKPAALPRPVSSGMPSSIETFPSITTQIPTTVLQVEAADDTPESSGQPKQETSFRNTSLSSLDCSAAVKSLPSLGFIDFNSETNVFDKSRQTLDG